MPLYALSDAFIMEECRDKYKELYQEELGEDINCCRTDQKLIKVIQLLGVENCSGSRTALRVDWIPQEMEEYLVVHDYDGQKTISIDYNEAYANILHTIFKNDNCLYDESYSMLEEEYKKYKRITYIREKMRTLPRRKINEMPDTMIFTYDLPKLSK